MRPRGVCFSRRGVLRLPPRTRRPRGERELTIIARTALALGLILFSTAPVATTQVAGFDPTLVLAAADGDPTITGAIPTPTGNFVNRPAKGDQLPAPAPTPVGLLGVAPNAYDAPSMLAGLFRTRATAPQQVASFVPPAAPVDSTVPEAGIDGRMVAAIDPEAPIGYAGDAGTEDFEAPFRALMMMPTARPQIDFPQPDPVADHDWVANEYPDSARTAPEMRCLAEAIYFEA